MTHDPKFDAPEFPARRCGRLDAHEPHALIVPRIYSGRVLERRTYHCPGFVVIEGGAECVEHQRPMSECRYLHEVERRARWSE